jgi:molybdopterin/thiamine biosynthesis adenylyltransferase
MNDSKHAQYSELTDRNIGIISEKEQNTLRSSKIAVFGLGGIGGVIAEQLARMGVGSLSIVDNDKFDITNSNRQIFSFNSTTGKYKTDITEKFLKDINPEIEIKKFIEVTSSNLPSILDKCNLAMLAIDSVRPCIEISRACRKLNIPIVEGWAIPFYNVRIVDKNTPCLETLYNLPTKNKSLDCFSSKDFDKMFINILLSLTTISGLSKHYTRDTIDKLLNGEISPRSFAPMVWLTSTAMVIEGTKLLLERGKLRRAPKFMVFDPWLGKIPFQFTITHKWRFFLWKSLMPMFIWLNSKK